ncbi:MAG: hypothetical protein EWV55_01325, partial [Microcystis viridis Mv_BB_P_19951000_S69]
ANGRGAPRAPKMSSRYFDKIEMHPNYPYSSSFHTKTRRANPLSIDLVGCVFAAIISDKKTN